MGTIASQITGLTIVYSTVYWDADQRKTSKLRVTGLCAGNSPGTGEFPAQMASYAENVAILMTSSWYAIMQTSVEYSFQTTTHANTFSIILVRNRFYTWLIFYWSSLYISGQIIIIEIKAMVGGFIRVGHHHKILPILGCFCVVNETKAAGPVLCWSYRWHRPEVDWSPVAPAGLLMCWLL